MSLDQRLSDAARGFAEGVAPPDVDLDAVRSQARANRRRTVALIAVAAVVSVVAAVTVVVGVGRDTSAPAPVNPAPSPRPVLGRSAPVWYDSAGLHNGNMVQQTPVELIGPNPAGGRMGVLALVYGGALYRDPATDDVWFHPWEGEPRVVGQGSKTGPAGDPAGDVAAWFEGDELVVYDTARGREISRTVQEATVTEYASTEYVNDGNAFLHVSSEEVVWRSEYTLGLEYLVGRLDLATGEFSTLWEAQLDNGGGVDPGHDANPRLIDVDDTTRVWADFENPPPLTVEFAGNEPLPLADGVAPFGKLNYDGVFLLTPTEDDDSTGAAIVNVDTGERWDVWQGDDDFYAWISWGYGDAAVIQVAPGGRPNGPVIVCDPVHRVCARLTTQGDVVLPTS